MNNIVLIGRLAQDPEMRYTPGSTAVTNFTIVVDRNRANEDGEREVDFIPVVVWSKLAEVVAQHMRKGRMVAIHGRLQIRSYENRDGQKVRVAEVIANEVKFLDRAPTHEEVDEHGEAPVELPTPKPAPKKPSASAPSNRYAARR